MSLLYPDLLKNRITDITPGDLRKLGVKGLLLDVDNTMTRYGSQQLDEPVRLWIEDMKRRGIGLTIVSNSFTGRVKPFAKRVGMRYIAYACKPLPFGFRRGARRLGLRPRECAAVGDQTFTDVIGSRLAGVHPIQLLPIEWERHPLQRVKRQMERHILKRYLRKNKLPGQLTPGGWL